MTRLGVFLPARTRRNAVLGLLLLAGCVNFIDRASVSIALPDIRAELHLTDAQAGLLLSAFAWSYGLAQLPAGALVDRLGARVAMAAGLGAWSVVQALSGLCRALPPFIVARVALGLSESPMFVGGARVCVELYPPAERAVPIGLLNASAALAPAIAPLVLAPLMAFAGWRAAFVAMGLAGFGVALAWARVYRNPARGAGDVPHLAGPAVWRALARQRTMCGLFLGFGGTIYVSWLYVTWLPGYLNEAWGLPAEHAALWSAVPQVFGFFGALGGGFLSDRLAARFGPRAGYQGPLVVGLLACAGLSVVAALAGTVAIALVAISASLFAANVATTSGWALAANLAPAALVATVEAAANIGASAGGSLAPLVTGYAVHWSGSFAPALLIAGAVSAACAGATWALTDRPIASPAPAPVQL